VGVEPVLDAGAKYQENKHITGPTEEPPTVNPVPLTGLRRDGQHSVDVIWMLLYVIFEVLYGSLAGRQHTILNDFCRAGKERVSTQDNRLSKPECLSLHIFYDSFPEKIRVSGSLEKSGSMYGGAIY
jgi:hypothetical protein